MSAAMQTPWSGDEMFEAFRALGGTAENIRLKEGEARISPGDPERPVLLRLPDDLLFPIEAFEIADGCLRLTDREDVSQAERDFFERYENAVGQPLYARTAAAIDALASLSSPVKEVLSGDFGMREWFEGDRAKGIEIRFLERRAIRRGEQRVIAPLLELAAHDPKGLAMESDKGIRITGLAPHGICIIHPFHDALAIFQRFGYVAAQPVAYSLPMSFASDGTEISILRDLHLTDQRGDVMVPQLNVIARDRLALTHLMIGRSGSPRLPRSIFRARMRDAGLEDADTQYDRIVQENTARFLKLLGVLEGEEGQTAISLRRMARHQLEAMSWSIGARDLEPITPSSPPPAARTGAGRGKRPGR